MPEFQLASGQAPHRVVDLLLLASLAPSKSQARRLIEQGGVAINNNRIGDINSSLTPADGPSFVIKVGKRRFARFLYAD